MFTQQNIKKSILDLEQKYPVDTWTVNSIHVWPYIRIKLYIHMLVLMNKKPLANKLNNKNLKNQIKVIAFLNNIFRVFKAYFSLAIFFSKLKQKQIVFFGSHMHRVFQNGEYFNRFYDSMVAYHKLQDFVYMVEYQKTYDTTYNKKAVIQLSKHLKHFKLLSKFTKWFSKEKNRISLNNYDAFYKELKAINLAATGVSETELVAWTQRIKTTNKFYEKFYKKIKPLKVVFLGYYGLDDIYSALVTANKLHIKTIDFQHGPQTNVHLAFSSWSKVPENGFNTMPKEFWNWDKASKENIDSWSDKIAQIKSKVVGQPYLAYWINEIQTKKINRQHIFYSLQTHPFAIQDLLTPKIITLIKTLDYTWVLRLHPRNNLNIDALHEFLKHHEIENKTIIQDAFNTPLPEALLSSILHITNYSGCLIEAYQLGIPTLIINEVGKEMFGQYIGHKLVHYLGQNDKNFQEQAEKIINNSKGEDLKTNYSEIFHPLN
ncbi:hypothetical protein GCM10023311_02580 [Flaviramulus aquimarinus]|uniref:Uncharacterized protein n=1 Tax=Flaviramulus aquimarinus TaxID=1170456 RepID=A0ABP9ERI5_9FLAO